MATSFSMSTKPKAVGAVARHAVKQRIAIAAKTTQIHRNIVRSLLIARFSIGTNFDASESRADAEVCSLPFFAETKIKPQETKGRHEADAESVSNFQP